MRILAILLAGLVVTTAQAGAAVGAGTPTAAQMRTGLRVAVRHSRARVKMLRVVLKLRRELELHVSGPDPAAYLKHRLARLLRVFNRLVLRFDRFDYADLHVFDPRRPRAVFWVTYEPYEAPGGGITSWNVDPKLWGCARGLLLIGGPEIDAEGAAPPCPVK